MTKVFISQPMKDRTDREIIEERAALLHRQKKPTLMPN